jgi:hypothetical protein
VWDQLLATAARAKERQAALRAIVEQVHAVEAWTKLVVFAPAGSAFESAAEALRALRRPVLIGRAHPHPNPNPNPDPDPHPSPNSEPNPSLDPNLDPNLKPEPEP